MVAAAMNLAHLRPEIRELARLPATERLARVPANRWIGYGRASQAMALLERLLASEPGRVRPRNLLVVGPTNNGTGSRNPPKAQPGRCRSIP